MDIRTYVYSPRGQIHVYVCIEACDLTYIHMPTGILFGVAYIHHKVKMVPWRTEHRSLAYLQLDYPG